MGNRDITYKYYQNNIVNYEVTCQPTSFSQVKCYGKNNQNGGTPQYTAKCDESESCIDTYNQIPAKNEIWIKDIQHLGQRPDCYFIPININNQNYNWGTLDQCKKKCI